MKEDDFINACDTGDIKAVLQFSGNVNYINKSGWSGLLIAAVSGHLDIIKNLINRGADINYKNLGNGWVDPETPLMLTCKHNHYDAAVLLLNLGADIDIKDKYGYTALMHATNQGNTSIVKMLLGNAADTSLINSDGYSAEGIAVYANQIPCLFVLNSEFIINHSKYGNALLIYSCESLEEDDILFQYEHGADFYFENENGESGFNILNTIVLTPALESFKEKLILDKMIDNENNEYSMSL